MLTKKPLTKGNRALLFSGGLDSVCVWRLLNAPPCVYVDWGHKYAEQELQTVASLQKLIAGDPFIPLVLRVIKNRVRLGDVERPNGYVPLRNLLLVAGVAAEHYTTIYLGALRGELARDTTKRFFRDTSALLSYVEGEPFKVIAPFGHLTKTQLVALYLKRFPDERSRQMLLASSSCYKGRRPGCGECSACFKRWTALTLNGISEPYEASPQQWGMANLTPAKIGALFARTKMSQWPALIQSQIDTIRAFNKTQ